MQYIFTDPPPPSIVKAADVVSRWMDENGHEKWQLCDTCSRKYAYDADKYRKVISEIIAAWDADDPQEKNDLSDRLFKAISEAWILNNS